MLDLGLGWAPDFTWVGCWTISKGSGCWIWEWDGCQTSNGFGARFGDEAECFFKTTPTGVGAGSGNEMGDSVAYVSNALVKGGGCSEYEKQSNAEAISSPLHVLVGKS
jgi:hypothetical protein